MFCSSVCYFTANRYFGTHLDKDTYVKDDEAITDQYNSNLREGVKMHSSCRCKSEALWVDSELKTLSEFEGPPYILEGSWHLSRLKYNYLI